MACKITLIIYKVNMIGGKMKYEVSFIGGTIIVLD